MSESVPISSDTSDDLYSNVSISDVKRLPSMVDDYKLNKDEETLINICYICRKDFVDHEYRKLLIEKDIIKDINKLLSHRSDIVVLSALNTLGKIIVKLRTPEIRVLIKCGLLK